MSYTHTKAEQAKKELDNKMYLMHTKVYSTLCDRVATLNTLMRVNPEKEAHMSTVRELIKETLEAAFDLQLLAQTAREQYEHFVEEVAREEVVSIDTNQTEAIKLDLNGTFLT